MVNLKNSLLSCLLVLSSFCFVSLQAQPGKKEKNKSQHPITITDIRLDGIVPPFLIEAGGMYKLSLQAEGESPTFYWGVYLDMDGNGTYDGDEETLWQSEALNDREVTTTISIPKSWEVRNTTIRIMVSDEPITSPERLGGNSAHEDLPATIPFTSQIDTGLDEKHDGCVDIGEPETPSVEVTLGILIPFSLIPADYTFVDVFIYGFDPNFNPLYFNLTNGPSTTFTTSLVQTSPSSNGEISLSIPLEVNLDYFNHGDRVSYNGCSMVFYMEVRGYRNSSSVPEIFYVQVSEDLSMPSIEYVIAPICDCEISGTQMDRKASEDKGYIKTYPNPTGNTLFLEYESRVEVEAKLIDMSGRVHQHYLLPAGSIKRTIDIKQLESGLYILELSKGENRHRFKLWKR